MTKLTRRMLGQAGVLILALVLALGTTVPAFANAEDELERRGFSGVVTVLEEESITVKTEDDESLFVDLTGNTSVRLPSGDVQSVMEVELREGARVAILAEVEADGSLTALWILVKPERPQVAHLLGTVITMEDNRVTMMDAQGNAHTVGMPVQALQGLQVGDVATFVVDQSDATGDGPGNPIANAAVTASQIQERVAAHAALLRQSAQAGVMSVATANERIEVLSDLMNTLETHVQSVLADVLLKVPPHVQATIELAMGRASMGFDIARAAIERAGPPGDIPPGGGYIGPPGGGAGPPWN